MKKIMIMALALTISMSAGAGPVRGGKFGGGHHAGGSHFYRGGRTSIIISPGFGYWGDPYLGFGLGWGYPYFGFGYPYYYGYPYYSSNRMPAVLSVKIDAIKSDYQLQIKDVRKNKTIPRGERRTDIAQLKNEREKAIINAEMNYRPANQNKPAANENQQSANTNPNNQ